MNIKEWAKASWASLTIAALMMQPLPTLAENPKNNGVADAGESRGDEEKRR